MLGDDPPYLSVGTEVSAKYKGAFCEAKIRKVVRSVKCRVTYKQGLGTSTVTDDQIKGTLRVGASVEAKHNDRKEYVDATITKIQDCSQYTVVFDDGDITTLRRTALCLKSGRHFAESETLDQLPLTHPEHFGNPVIGGRRGRRSRQTHNDSGSTSGGKEGPETEPEIGRVVCVELGDKKKKDNWFPGLVVAPTAQDTVRIRVRDEYLVRSFKDARYYTVPKKEATEFTKDLVNKIENSTLKVAVEKALLFLEKNELPPHWDRDSLFGTAVSSGNSDSDAELDSDSSDDEPREEKDHFVAQLYKFMDDRGTPINNCPMIGNEDIDLYRLFRAVYKLGGYNRVTNQNQWKLITRRLGFSMQNNASTHNLVKQAYKKFLHSFEDFYRKLGCTMVNHPRGSMRKQRPGRSLIRDKDRNTPVPTQDKPLIRIEKEEEDKRSVMSAEDDVKRDKREIKKEIIIKQDEEALTSKVKRKDEPIDESASGQDSDINIDAEEESSCSEKSLKSSSRLTPSSGIGTKSKVTAKAKEEPFRKKQQPLAEKKKLETKRPDKKEDKSGLKDEESTKTRSKSKDDVVNQRPLPSSQQQPSQPQQQQQQQQQQPPQQQQTVKLSSLPPNDSRETKTPSRETDKKPVTSKMRKLTEEEMKKRGRKKKEVESVASAAAGAATAERAMRASQAEDRQTTEYAPTYKGPVELGDRLKVYYDSKMTYEAKVIDIEKDGVEAVYLVHYTGWNTRYDEWIKCSRIAQNFTQSQGRIKRAKAQARPPTPGTSVRVSSSGNVNKAATPSTSLSGRRRAVSVAPSSKDSEDRASTPVSRTKSPASTAASSRTSARQLARSQRRASGHAEPVNATPSGGHESEDSEDSESAAESDVSTAEAQPRESRSRSRPQQQQAPPPPPPQERGRREARRRAESRMKIEETSDHEDPDKDSEEADMQPQSSRRGPSRRLRKPPGETKSAAKVNDDAMIKSEPDTDTDDQPKGRDFDLNEIRSELKGFDKAVKLEITSNQQEAITAADQQQQPVVPIKLEKSEPETRESVEQKILPGQIDANSVKCEQTIKLEASQADNTEDIYEFKEPEPFEFEVRNKRDSSGSEKDKEKDKDKMRKRALDEELKSPKKRQKGVTPTTSVKVDTKLEQTAQATESSESKKKSRKIFKKSEDVDDEPDSEDSAKYAPVTFSNSICAGSVIAYNAKVKRIVDDILIDEPDIENDVKARKIITLDEGDAKGTPKKRPTKNLLSSSPAISKASEISSSDNTDAKKRPRKVFGKKLDEAEDDEEDSSKELDKFFSSYTPTKPVRKPDSIPETSRMAPEIKDVKMKKDEDLAAKGVKKRQKPSGVPGSEIIETKKKPLSKRMPKRNYDDSESDEDVGPPKLTPVKYLSHYSGPKAKAALSSETESVQDRTINKSAEPKKLSSFSSLTPGHEVDESNRSKITAVETDKKRVEQSGTANKAEPKQEMKVLDFTPVVPHSLPVPAPISARLPATASIEEKLSLAAASVFRAKVKDAKRDEEPPNETVVRKVVKEMIKKTEPAPSIKKVKDKDESKTKHESIDKRKQPEQIIPIKDPLQDFEPHHDPLLEVINKREEETAKTLIPSVVKTYANQKKIEQTAKTEESWKKTKAATVVTAPTTSIGEANKDYIGLRREVVPNKMKPSIDRDSVDSSDSSDSERRLTIIDSEDAADDKCIDFNLEAKVAKPPVETVNTCYNASTNRGPQEKSVGIGLVASVIQAKIARIEEDGENLNSLLCEEEIPGSPTPSNDLPEHEPKTSISAQNLLQSEIANKVSGSSIAGTQIPLNQQQASSFTVVSAAGSSVAVSQSSNSIIPMSTQVSSTLPLRQPQGQLLGYQQQQQSQAQSTLPAPMQSQVAPVVAALQVVAGLAVQRRQSSEAAPVTDNTPPTTPDSTISNVSGSPRDERTGGSTLSSSEDNNGKTNSSEAENESAGTSSKTVGAPAAVKIEDGRLPLLSPEFSVETQPHSSKSTVSKRGAIPDSENISPKKRKKRKDQDTSAATSSSPGPSNVSGKKSPRQATRHTRGQTIGSDSDDTSESSTQYNNSTSAMPVNTSNAVTIGSNVITGMNSNSIASFSTNSNRPMRYNFLTDLDPNLDSNQRIQVLMQRITDLRKAYGNCKVELAAIERRRKKIKRRKREAQKAAKAEMQQACL
ncbi:AT-rich interactive domain-containing protein 4B isoform X2 [Phymastichus coffea]|uniref:AT-rich interactive domain-containing protein 4B isoform X2 n=1 Tax=Phymastichus coffea TaxID=108790 RepID=UPI00273C180C|nr:AT-rich interactive domain-containing protein 4B isoform X2 [Phymastichus coffea]